MHDAELAAALPMDVGRILLAGLGLCRWGFQLLEGRNGDGVRVPAGEEIFIPTLVYAGLLEVNKVWVFSAVFAAPQRAIRALV